MPSGPDRRKERRARVVIVFALAMAASHQRGVMLRPWNGIPRAAGATWVPRSYLKNASDSRWRRCTPLKNAHNLPRLLRFFIGVRLTLSCDLLFLRWLLHIRDPPDRFEKLRAGLSTRRLAPRVQAALGRAPMKRQVHACCRGSMRQHSKSGMVFKVNLCPASDRVPIGMRGGCTGAGGLAKRVDVHLRAYYPES